MIGLATLLLLLMTMLALLARHGAFASRVLIVGTSPLARGVVAEMIRRPSVRRRIAGVVVDDANAVEPPVSSLVAGPLSRLGAIIREVNPDRIVIALTDRRGRLPMRELLAARVGGVVIEDGVDCYERLTGKIAIEALSPSTLIASRDFRKTHFDLAFGHGLSLIVSISAMVVLLPLFAAIAILIKLDSPGPIFFVHDRVGFRGRRVRLLKFRTMRPADGPTSEWERDNDHRITRVGRWLRKYRLDELPQLINVVRGELNLVGPRPHPQSNFALFSREIPYYSLRSCVRPGLTGWAQVRQGYANGLDEETEKMRYDLYYIKHMSAWLDVRILFQTVLTVLAGREHLQLAPVPAVSGSRRASMLWWVGRLRLAALRTTRT
jgi:exopolysaccharide biosynthesis polyprenyl glycosylphosphotransferase